MAVHQIFLVSCREHYESCNVVCTNKYSSGHHALDYPLSRMIEVENACVYFGQWAVAREPGARQLADVQVSGPGTPRASIDLLKL